MLFKSLKMSSKRISITSFGLKHEMLFKALESCGRICIKNPKVLFLFYFIIIGELPDDWHRTGDMASIMELDRNFLFPGKCVKLAISKFDTTFNL
mgnify:CR=1 FL=1